MSFARRKHPRRQPPAVHRPAPVAPETPAEVLERALEGTPLELLEPAPVPPLSKERIARLEALTAVWMRETRIGGPQPEDTLLYAAPKPPPPPPRASPDEAYVPEPLPTVDEDRALESDPVPAAAPAGTPRVVRDWVSRHDPRSRDFDVKARLRARVPVQDRVWEIGPVFDQGTTPPLSARDASGCVGMAVAAAANVLHLATPGGLDLLSDLLSKDDALELYDRAQRLDHVSGEKYAGTSVLAGMLAGREAGLWPEFLWAFGTRDIAQAVLQVGPVVVGIPWDTGLEEPDVHGIIRPGGKPAGGHALAVVGLVMQRGNAAGPFFVLQQSRGTAEGDGGRVYLHHKHLTGLLAGVGEAAIPVPPGGLP
jgi:hypothetical protein